VKYCPNCGFNCQDTDVFCSGCGFKLQNNSYIPPSTPNPVINAPYKPMYTSSVKTPRNSNINYGANFPIAPLSDRCFASIVDGFIAGAITLVCGFGCFYSLFKDGIIDGRSLGKNLMGLRVIKYYTNEPANYWDSCGRNCCNCCVLVLCFNHERRHVGDLIAGTIVIKDE
jgi:hypothetical protein